MSRRELPLPNPSHIAIRCQARARQVRARAGYLREEKGDYLGAKLAEADAAKLERQAETALDPSSYTTRIPRRENGGELVIVSQEVSAAAPDIVDTVRARGDMLTADASLQRLDLLAEVGALTLGVDAAESIQAQNSLERMLAHQVAAAHRMALEFMAEGREELAAYRNSGANYPHRSVEACRMANTGSRLMDTAQRGLLVLDRLRNGGAQPVTQHVNVADGGKAVVAGMLRQERKAEG